jgi:thiamine pyrophosphokinase
MPRITPSEYSGGVLLALDGILPDTELIAELRTRHSILVAADGAALALRKRGILSDVVIGDLDSVGEMGGTLAADGAEIIEIANQEQNDFEKALLWGIERGERAVTIIGMGGGMVDHALNNFSVLARYARRLRLSVHDDISTAWAVSDSLEFTATAGNRVSLIPLPQVRLTTSGLVWQLDNEVLAIGEREGASNRAAADNVTVQVSEGLVMIFHFQ